MPYDFTRYLVIGISSRALFDLQHEDEIFENQGIDAYSRFQIEHEEHVLAPGAGFGLVRGFLRLNQLVEGKRRTEVVVMSRNNADTCLRIFNSIERHDLDITRAALTSGASLAPYLKAFDVDLFLSADAKDVQAAVDAGVAAARIYQTPPNLDPSEDQIRIAFDADAVVFSEESEAIYQAEGIEAFLAHERANARKPLPEGPFAKLLKTLSALQHQFGTESNPIRTALVTSRNSPAHERVVRTLRAWEVRVDEAFFLGGGPKDGILKAFGPHIFFDDQDVHLRPAAQHVAVAHVPYPSGSAIQLELVDSPSLENSKPRTAGRKRARKSLSPKSRPAEAESLVPRVPRDAATSDRQAEASAPESLRPRKKGVAQN